MKKGLIVLIMLCIITPSVSAQQNNMNKPRTIFSDSAVIIDSQNGSVLYSKNGNKRMDPASITKIATAIYAIEHADLDEQVKISERASKTEGSTVYLSTGESMSLEQLLKGLMVNSGNDAAVAIAEHTEGSVKRFVDKLNVFLEEEVGVEDTHFENPHGLYGKNHYTTAYDMAKITSYALKNKQFQALFDIKSLDWKAEGWNTTLYNHHKMVKGEIPYPEVTGGKNGYIPESRHTLVTSAENEKLSIVVVTMKAQSKRAIYSDTKKLLDYGLNQFERNYIPKETIFQLDGTSYDLERDIPYTQPVSGKVTQKLEQDGVLTLYNEDHEKMLSTNLIPVKETPIIHSEAVASSEHKRMFFGKELSQQLLLYPFIIYMALLFIAGLAIFRRESYNK
ncbi:D-alanyl-D-alanine carboxypeptidase [Rossellomorea aquimaris]|uniref:D-alanyl-D-alanine carboxypeptidase family protein n=1 Tax=Rossellomorea aquimaris TaxID=189382 RepID=UPI001CD5C28F|nr:D-alanyl-D-alanine carboxypeptidase family protein [Rossellomorea aquimaris]MCA1058577.1 D-alanyl-D-alanine carboxypeptidase [Rossellomorea aquimaris]